MENLLKYLCDVYHEVRDLVLFYFHRKSIVEWISFTLYA